MRRRGQKKCESFCVKYYSIDNESMDRGILLTEKTKEELIDIILGQDERIRELEERFKAAQKKRAEKFAKGDTKRKRKKRPGRKKGHEGITRRIPEDIDEIIEETLNECPKCRHM